MRGPAVLPAIGHDHVAESLRPHSTRPASRSGDQRRDLCRAEIRNFAKWIDAGDKTDFRLEDVANAGQHFLMKQNVADLLMGTRKEALCGGLRVEIRDSERPWLAEECGGPARAIAAVCMCATGTRKPTAWHTLFSSTMRMLRPGCCHALADAVDVPTAAHEHVSHENTAAGEIDEQPLATRLDAIDVLAREWGVVVKARESG